MIEFYAMLVRSGAMTLEQIDEYWRGNVEDEIRRKNGNGL